MGVTQMYLIILFEASSLDFVPTNNTGVRVPYLNLVGEIYKSGYAATIFFQKKTVYYFSLAFFYEIIHLSHQ